MGNDNDVDIFPQSELREAIDQQMHELSTRTVIFHHFIGERLGLNPTDHKCLDIIIRATNPITAGRLADETGLTTGAITGVMDRLEQAGYVKRERDPNDRRLIFINPLLDKAMAKIGPLFAPVKLAGQKLYSKYTDQELAVILDFVINCNKMTQEMTAKIRAEVAADIKTHHLEDKSDL